MVVAVLLTSSHAAMAITNAELARLNNQLIGLDAQLAVAKKQSELDKYRAAGVQSRSPAVTESLPAPPRLNEPAKLEMKTTITPKRDGAGEVEITPRTDGAKHASRKSRAQ